MFQNRQDRLPFIGFHYDIARGAYLRPEYFIEALHRAAETGFTHFLPYLENMISLSATRKACPSCAYTPEQWRAFDQAAKASGIELVPHFNVVGHSVALCRTYPELMGASAENEMDITLPAVTRLVDDCLREFCSFSDSKYFLIGGDEYQFPAHLLRDPAFEPARAYAEHINAAIGGLVALGRTPILWHDMLIHYPQTLDLLSRDAVIAFWFYDEDSDYPLLDMLQVRGFKAIMASGLCSGLLTRRRLRAARRQVQAALQYRCHGFMMTTWEDCRFEKQRLNIGHVGRVLRGEDIPDAYLEANSLGDILVRTPKSSSMSAKGTKARLGRLLKDGLWNSSPDYAEYRTAVFGEDRKSVIDSYLKYHLPEGPLFDALRSGGKGGGANDVPSPELSCDSGRFGITVTQAFGTAALTIENGDERLLIYPQYGASLQGYQKQGTVLIPHSIPRFLKRSPSTPGGYRSYSAVGGLRPIWAFGTHHNPCIVWQGPFDWNIGDTGDRLRIVLSRDLYHVAVTYRVTVQKGTSGFTIEAEACNKVDGAYGTFGFNLPLSLPGDEVATTTLEWEGNAVNPANIGDSFFVIPSTGELTIRSPRVSLRIFADKDQTAGFYTDWQASAFITPDLRGKYRRLRKGDCYRTVWRFESTLESPKQQSILIENNEKA